MIPVPHASFLARVVSASKADPRFVGVAAGGSFCTRTMDAWSDLDLVLAIEDAAFDAVMRERCDFAATLGPVLSAFTGEHVGEPRLVICLYGGEPPLHVDLKFVASADIAVRVEDPVIVWERDGRLSQAFEGTSARYAQPSLQWIEDRFWVWVHYAATKIARGEYFEVLDSLAFIRARVLGPLALESVGARPAGVRRIERAAPAFARELLDTVATADPTSCVNALAASANLYRRLRDGHASPNLELRAGAETAAIAYLDQVATVRRLAAQRVMEQS